MPNAVYAALFSERLVYTSSSENGIVFSQFADNFQENVAKPARIVLCKILMRNFNSFYFQTAKQH